MKRKRGKVMSLWKGFKRFWHDQITTPNGDVDGARVGLLIILIGGGFYIYFEWYAIVMKAQVWDPVAFADGLIKVGAALLTAAAGVLTKAGTEAPYNPSIAAANFPGDAGAQAAVAGVADSAASEVQSVAGLAQTEIQSSQGVLDSIVGFFKHVMAYFHKKPPTGGS
jgi:hypothetical protein